VEIAMRQRWAAAAVLLLGGCNALEPPNTDLGVRVWAEVRPQFMRLSDSAAALRIRIRVGNPSAEPLEVVTGGPPYTVTPDPANSHGLLRSFRIASELSPLNAGPGQDGWGAPTYVLPAKTVYYEETVLTLARWRDAGWPVTPGEYWVRSYFNGQEGEPAYFRLVP
jgi:hypothetical protein